MNIPGNAHIWAGLMAAIAWTATPAPARATQPLNYTILGAGSLSCGTWKEHRQTNDLYEASMENWVLGYVTAANSFEVILKLPQPSAASDSSGMFGWLDNYCADHPLEDLSQATMKLVMQLNAIARAASPVTPQH